MVLINNAISNDLLEYNRFCHKLSEGCILYNMDSTNLWGEYLLVVNITTIKLWGQTSYTVLLIGLKKSEGSYTPYNMRIKLTPDYAKNIPFLKQVGKCRFSLIPVISDLNVDTGLITVYGDTNLRRYNSRVEVRKPKRRKYGKDGKLIIKKVENES